jgi:hypothetical protein
MPAAPGGALALIVVSLATVNDGEATVPKCTAVTPRRFDPLMVTMVPPVVGPLAGLTEVTTGVPGSIATRVCQREPLKYSPTAAHAEIDVQETPPSSSPPPNPLSWEALVLGLETMDQAVPFHCSMRVWS